MFSVARSAPSCRISAPSPSFDALGSVLFSALWKLWSWRIRRWVQRRNRTTWSPSLHFQSGWIAQNLEKSQDSFPIIWKLKVPTKWNVGWWWYWYCYWRLCWIRWSCWKVAGSCRWDWRWKCITMVGKVVGSGDWSVVGSGIGSVVGNIVGSSNNRPNSQFQQQINSTSNNNLTGNFQQLSLS